MAPPLTGAVHLPDGTLVRGRGVRHPTPTGPEPEFGLYLGVPYEPVWPHAFVDWPDFGVPRDPQEAVRQLKDAYCRARAGQRVEIACSGGWGRTGTGIAAIAILAGEDSHRVVAWVRAHYHPRAVETPWQRRWVRRFPELLARDEQRR